MRIFVHVLFNYYKADYLTHLRKEYKQYSKIPLLL